MSTQNSLKRPSYCDELAELLPAFAAGSLNSQEVETVKRLLQLCPDMQLDLSQYTAIMSAFYERITPVAPPRSLHDRLMKKLHSRPAAEQAPMDEPHNLPELLMSTQTDLRDD